MSRVINKEKIILNKIILHPSMEFRHTWKSSALTHYNKKMRALDLQPHVKAISSKTWTTNHSFFWLTSPVLMPNIAWSILLEQGLRVVMLNKFINMWVNEKQLRFFMLIQDGNAILGLSIPKLICTWWLQIINWNIKNFKSKKFIIFEFNF